MSVLLAMSGGVDSCVAAHLLKSKGHDVTGITLVFHPDVDTARCNLKVCCDAQDMLDAKSVCQAMDIPHVTLDLSAAFNRKIIMPFVDMYRLGETPNPCGRCNRLLKIGYLVEQLAAYNCDKLATGHYCRIVNGQLYRGVDHDKDQSYFLSMVRADHLQHMIFPLGELHKTQTRKIAEELNLPVADKQESQELCFTGGRSPGEFVTEHLKEQGGFIKHVSGRILGTHTGLSRFTVGQRKGLGVSWSEPLYVVELDGRNRTVFAGERKHLEKRTIRVHQFNWISPMDGPVCAAIRYNQEPAAVLSVEQESTDTVVFHFADPIAAVAKGQILTAFHEDRVIGGGIITGAL